MKTLVVSAGNVASRARIGSHDLVFDQHPAVPGGTNRGPSPLDVLAVSVGACAHYYAAAYLYGRGIPTADLVVEVDAEKTAVPVHRLGKLALTIRVPPQLSDRERAGIERAIRSCPAYGTLVHPPDLAITIETALHGNTERLSA